ncbi:hypothetical protein V6Z11_D03G125900 [Gossypium hirsutum]
MYRFKAWWTLEDSCEAKMKRLWSLSKGEIQIWLQFMMKGLQRWATSIKKSQNGVIKELYRKLDQLNSMERDEKALDALVGGKLNLNIEIDNKELYWEHGVRVNWLKNGDRNTTFFHRPRTQRRRMNQVKGL